jgi:hypothetical protein
MNAFRPLHERQVESIERTAVFNGDLRDCGGKVALQNCNMKKTANKAICRTSQQMRLSFSEGSGPAVIGSESLNSVITFVKLGQTPQAASNLSNCGRR